MTERNPKPRTTPPTDTEIAVAAIVFRDAAGRVLCVRKHSSPRFQLPGGKLEAGETTVDAALRETREEVGLDVDRSNLSYLGTFSAEASNEPGHTVTSTVYVHPMPSRAPEAAAEIAETAWIDPLAPAGHALAPLLSTRIFPALTQRRIQSVTVFAGANPGTDTAHLELARRLGQALGQHRMTLVYGGSKLGLMGEVAKEAHAHKGTTIGVLTTHLANYELKYEGLDRLELVGSMSERKAMMSQLGEAFVALPGGTGTLDEFFEEWTNQQLGTHTKPIGLLGRTFWQPLIDMVDHMVAHGFVRQTDRDHLIVADEPEEMIQKLQAWLPPVPRWTD